MNCYRYLNLLFLFYLVPCSLCGQQTDFLKWISGSVEAIDKNTSNLRLVFEIEPGLHIQSNKPTNNAVFPTSIALEQTGDLLMEAPRFPHPETMRLEGSDQLLEVFSGRFEVFTLLRHQYPGQKSDQITGVIQYQACDKNRCFYPRELGFEISLEH